MLTDFQNSFTGRLTGKFATNSYLNIPPHLKYVATLLLWFLILKSRYVALDSVDNSNDCKKWLVDLTIVSVWNSSVVLL